MKYISKFFIFALWLMTVVACDNDKIYFTGPNYVMFADSLLDMPVTENEELLFEVVIGATHTSNVDRSYIVDVDLKRTNAIEGYHFDIISRNVTIKAGERTTKVLLKGYYHHMNVEDSLAVTLCFLGNEDEFTELYNDWTNVRLHKCMPFNIDDYTGNMRMTCTFPFSTSSVTTFLVTTEKKNDSTLIVKSPFDDSHNLTLKFHTAKDDPFDTTIDMTEQIAFTDSYYGEVAMSTIEGVDSYYLPSERAFVLILNVFIPKIGSFGNYYYIFEWVTPEQAEAEKNGISNPY
ncbi:MAG: DUF4984 domain-containing protein [Bacteroidaceae bacterium]|nr:DUF4984 domain-containing protein [Bacteroidaceae bacterium]